MEPPLASCDTLECLLPASIEVNKHHESTFVNICKTLEKVVEEDIDMSTRKHILGVQNILRVLNFSLKAKFAMNIETRGRMVTLLLKLICRKEGNRRLQSSLMNICTTLTQNKLKKSASEKLCCAWGRVICTIRALFTRKSIFERYAGVLHADNQRIHQYNLHKLIRNVSKYFTKEFSMRILKRAKS